jgi:peptide deformylase
MEETALRIRWYGDPALRKKSTAVKGVADKHRLILSTMAQLMYKEGGIGLAAPQVGINLNMIVVDIGTGLYKLINPKILSKGGSFSIEEGCLSVPGVCIKVGRAKSIVVEARDDAGKEIKVEAEDLLACVIQHEMDHLRGKLIVDYAGLIDKIKFKQRLDELKKRSKIGRLSESETKVCRVHL